MMADASKDDWKTHVNFCAHYWKTQPSVIQASPPMLQPETEPQVLYVPNLFCDESAPSSSSAVIRPAIQASISHDTAEVRISNSTKAGPQGSTYPLPPLHVVILPSVSKQYRKLATWSLSILTNKMKRKLGRC